MTLPRRGDSPGVQKPHAQGDAKTTDVAMAEHIEIGWRVRLKHGGTEIGTVLSRDWATYLCQVAWPLGQSIVHEMYLERVQ